MRSVFSLALVVVLAALAPSPARACDPRSTTTVVGFDKGGTHALIREEGPGILLYPVDLKTGAKGTEIEILSLDEFQDEAKAKALRAARWKKAEAALTAQGFVIAPGKGLAKDGAVGTGISVVEEGAGNDEETGFMKGRLVAKRGSTFTVLHEYSAPPSDAPTYTPPTLSPDGRFFVVDLDGCGVDVLVFAVADINARLAAQKK